MQMINVEMLGRNYVPYDTSEIYIFVRFYVRQIQFLSDFFSTRKYIF